MEAGVRESLVERLGHGPRNVGAASPSFQAHEAHGLRRASYEMGSILEIVLIALFAATLLMATATVFSRVVHQARGVGYP